MAKRNTSKHPKLRNGFGRITEIKTKKLRNPFRAMLTVGRTEEGMPIGKILGYYKTWYEAYDALAEYHKNPYDLEKSSLTINILYEKWSKTYFKELTSITSVRTVESAWSYVTPTFRKIKVDTIQPQMLKDFILNDACRKEGTNTIYPSDGIRSRIKSIFNLMFDYAVLDGICCVNPARQFSLKGLQGKIEGNRKSKSIFSGDQINDLWHDLNYGCTRIILINIYSGWRPKELLSLKKADINLEEMTMIGGMKTDAGRNRIVPIHTKVQDLIKYYYYKSDGELLFYDYEKIKIEKLTYDKYRRRFDKIMEKHGWNDFSCSCPRHTFSTIAKECKMEELARKLIMGHEIRDVTDKHYTHLDLVSYLHSEIKKIQ